MRTFEEISHDLSYLTAGEDATTRSFIELQTELLLDIRGILLALAQANGVDILGFFEKGGEAVKKAREKAADNFGEVFSSLQRS